MNPAQSYHPTPSLNRHNTAKDGVWQVVHIKDKGKRIVEGIDLEVSARVSSHGLKATDRVRSFGITGCDASSSDYVLCSVNHLSFIYENRTSTIPIDNSFNGLIPYVYDIEDNSPLDDCVRRSQEEGSHEEDDTNEKTPEIVAVTTSASPISGSQKKKEAKMLFSGSRPKGRHQS